MSAINQITFDAYVSRTDELAAEAMHLCAMAAEIKFDQAGRARRVATNPLGHIHARMEELARQLDERGLCAAATQLRRWSA